MTQGRNLRLDLLLLFGLVLLAVVEFSSFLTSGSFGSEFTQFFLIVHDRSPAQILKEYLSFNGPWYRPTQFVLPYWIGQVFIGWHNPQGWRAYELATVLVVSGLIYWLVLTLLPGRRVAAFLAALYFTCVPVILSPLYELAAFDFLHIVFTLLSAIAFLIGYRLRTWHGVAWTALSLLSYAAALTSKEVTIVIPVYLAVISAVLYFYEPGPGERIARVLREAKRLAPFFLLTLFYWWIHVRRLPMQHFSASADYRMSVNWDLILENLSKYPLWLARIYGHTTDLGKNAAGYQNVRNDVVGIAALLLVCFASILLWRSGGAYRKYLLLAVAWIGVFLSVPIYSGGYFWHGNLALCGYCMLFGAAIDWLASRIPARALRFAVLALVIAGMVELTRLDAAACMISGIHSETYRINSTVVKQPPVSFQRMQELPKVRALVYVEDRQNLGSWYYGAGSLFNYVYLRVRLFQDVVPEMNKVPRAKCEEWIKEPNAFFFRYDGNYRWYDASNEFRAFVRKKLAEAVMTPKITSVSPPETHAGVAFNVQPNGLSAIGVAGQYFEAGAEILINGKKQPTVNGDGFVSTVVSREVYAHPGNLSIQVRNPGDVVSEAFLIRVLP
ncbi:MAG: hypothetical protein ABJF23_31610 [Bryobacteraceae bacterium]